MSKEATQGGPQHPLTLGSSISAKQNPSSFKQDSRHFPVVWAGLETGFLFVQLKVSRTQGASNPTSSPLSALEAHCWKELPVKRTAGALRSHSFPQFPWLSNLE